MSATRMSATRRRPLTLALVGGALLCALAALEFSALRPAYAGDKVWESTEQNVKLAILDDGTSRWEWLTSRPEWKKTGIVRAARRVLEKLKNDKAPQGQGAMMHLAIRKADADAKLSDLAGEGEVRDFLLKRFTGDEPEVEEEEGTVASATNPEGHPCVILRAEGTANNLLGKGARCLGVLVITSFKEKLYLLRMYAFPTEFDEEGLSVDLDYMEGNALELLSTKLDDKAGVKPKPPAEEEKEPEEKERTEPETIENRDQKWRITIHKKLRRQVLTEEEDAENLVLKIEHNDQHGSCMLYMYAPQTTVYIDGVKAAPPNLVQWITTDWWNTFTTTHPEGDLFTWKWPKKQSGKNPTFITLPDLSEEKNRIDVIVGKTKRPVEVSQSEARKMGFAEKPKKNSLGKKGKGGEAMRGCLEGNRPRLGKETVFRFAWRSPSHSYRLFVSFSRDGYKKWGDAMRETIESLEFVKKFK